MSHDRVDEPTTIPGSEESVTAVVTIKVLRILLILTRGSIRLGASRGTTDTEGCANALGIYRAQGGWGVCVHGETASRQHLETSNRLWFVRPLEDPGRRRRCL